MANATAVRRKCKDGSVYRIARHFDGYRIEVLIGKSYFGISRVEATVDELRNDLDELVTKAGGRA